jgi:hypothetical protein
VRRPERKSPLERPCRRRGLSLSLSTYIYLLCLVDWLVSCLLVRSHRSRKSAGRFIASLTDTPASRALSSLEFVVVLRNINFSVHRTDNFTQGMVMILGYSVATYSVCVCVTLRL